MERPVQPAVPRRGAAKVGQRWATPAALVEAINAAQAELEADEVEQARQPETKTINRAEVYMMIDYLGDVGAALNADTRRAGIKAWSACWSGVPWSSNLPAGGCA
jgi:hypothetical protein